MNRFDDLFNNSPAEQQSGTQLSKEEYATKKQAERDYIFGLSDNTALAVANFSDKFQQYLDVQGTFGRYSTVNALLIMAQKPEATRVGSFEFWKEKGGYVKSGQTSISILEPHEYTKEDGTTGTGYNLKKVFDISQVDTRKVKAHSPTPTYTERQLLQALISKASVKIVGVETMPYYASETQGAIFNLSTNEIFVQRGMAFEDTFQSVAQELALAEIARDPNNVPDNPPFSAYCVAYLLCKRHGVDTHNFDFSDAPDVFDGLDAQAVKGELSQIRNTAENISGRMDKQLDTVTKTAKSQDARVKDEAR